MAKKTKAAPALNWRTGGGYPEHGERTDLWAWEFLRRNPEYKADWRRFLAVAGELRGSYAKPYDNLPDNWESDPGRPYWIISKAADEGDTRARVYDPPAQGSESESEYISRIRAAGIRSWRSISLAGALGARWGLEKITDPAQPKLGITCKWELSPHSVYSPGAHRHSRESSWVRTLTDLAEMLRPDPLPDDALAKARRLLEAVPQAWQNRIKEMQDDVDTTKRGRFVLEFDLRVSIPEQLKHAGDWLEREQAVWKKTGGDVWSDGRRNKETPGYAIYLRALDALEELGTNYRAGIAQALISGYKPAACYDERKRHLDSVSAWVKRAKQFRDGEYRRLVAMSVMPTLAKYLKQTEQKE